MTIENLDESWNGLLVFISFVIACCGSFVCVNAMEMYRLAKNDWWKNMYMALAAGSLGGTGIWTMHFVGMFARELSLKDEPIEIYVKFDVWVTLLSLIVAVLLCWGGLYVASKDPYFAEVMRDKRLQLMTAELEGQTMAQLKSIDSVKLKIMLGQPQYHIMGAICAASGVCVMHYCGIIAMRTHNDAVETSWDLGIISASVIVAIVAAFAAFMIIFRVLTFFPGNKLRMISSVIFGMAVCGMHYTGMAAARYTVDIDAYFDGDPSKTVGFANPDFSFAAICAAFAFNVIVMNYTVTSDAVNLTTRYDQASFHFTSTREGTKATDKGHERSSVMHNTARSTPSLDAKSFSNHHKIQIDYSTSGSAPTSFETSSAAVKTYLPNLVEPPAPEGLSETI